VLTIVLFSSILQLEVKSIKNLSGVYEASFIEGKEKMNISSEYLTIIEPVGIEELELLSENKIVEKMELYKSNYKFGYILNNKGKYIIYLNKYARSRFDIKKCENR
jgi:hypothetical protein